MEVAKGLPSNRRHKQRPSSNRVRRVLDALVQEYLAVRGFDYSLSVFRPESGCHELSHEEVLHTLRIQPGSELHALLKEKGFGRLHSGEHQKRRAFRAPVWVNCESCSA